MSTTEENTDHTDRTDRTDHTDHSGLDYVAKKLRFQVKSKLGWHSLRYVLEFAASEFWTVTHLSLIVANYWMTSTCYVFHREHTTPYVPFITACDIIYILDFIMSLMVKYSRKLKIHLEKQPRSFASLIFDAFLVLPIPNVYLACGLPTNTLVFILLRSNALLRLHRMQSYMAAKNNEAGSNHWRFFVIQYLVTLFLLHHTCACCWYIAAFPIGQTKVKQGWVLNPKIYKDVTGTERNWYIICLYFALLTSSYADFGDIVPLTNPERLVAMLFKTLGFILSIGIFIGVLSAYFVNYYKRVAYLRMQVITIKQFVEDIDLPAKYRAIIMEYYNILWTKKSGVHQPTDLKSLPNPLIREIWFDINIRALKCSILFRDKPEAFLRSVAGKMVHEFFQPGEMIFFQHVLKRRMIFIVLGAVEVLSDEDDQSPIIRFGPGTCLGETSLMMSLPSKASVRAATYVELQILYRRDFIDLILLYPLIHEDMVAEIRERIGMAEGHHDELELHKDEEVELNFYKTNIKKRKLIRQLKDKLKGNVRFPPKQDTYLRMYSLDEDTVSDRRRDAICVTAKFPWIIYPNTSLYWFWEIVIIITALFIAIAYPYFIVFKRVFPDWLGDAAMYIDLIYVFDILIMLSTAVEKGNVLIITHQGILNERLKQFGFYLDICSALLLEVFSAPFTENKRIHTALKMNRVLKTYRICYLFWCIEHKLNVPIFSVRLIKYPIYLLMASYWYGALMYMVTCFNPLCDEKGWFYKKMLEDIRNKLSFPCTSDEILTSFYFGVVILSGISYGDILPYSMKDTVMVYFGVILGMLLFGYCTAELSATITHRLKPRTDFQGTLFSVMHYLRERKINQRVVKRVREFFKVQWAYNCGFSISGATLFYNASETIKVECSVTEKYDIIAEIPLFQHMNRDFLRFIGTIARVIVLPPNEVICYEHEYVRNVYIIQSGYCIRTTGNVNSILMTKSYFGAVQLFCNFKATSTIRSLTHVKLLCITEEHFFRVFSIFPKDRRLFHEASSKLDYAKIDNILSAIKVDQRNSYDRPPYKVKGSFINVIRYCREHEEKYSEPFKKLGVFSWIKFLLLPICIVPHGTFLKYWVGIRIVVALCIALLAPYNMIRAPYPTHLDYVLVILDAIAFIDLYLMLFVGFYGSKQQLIIHPVKTSERYLKGKFILDLIFCVPFDYIFKKAAHWSNAGYSKGIYRRYIFYTYCGLKLLRLGQTYRLLQLMDYFQSDITSFGTLFQVMKFVPLTLILINTWSAVLVIHSCLFIYISDLGPGAIENGIAKPEGMAGHPLPSLGNETAMFCDYHSWFDRSPYRTWTSINEVFLVAYYFCTTTITGVGIGDITPFYHARLIMVIIMIICGVLFLGFVYASISSAKADWNTALSQNQEMIKELKRFMDQERVKKQLQNQIIEGFEYRWKRSRGAETHKVMSKFHPALHEDVFLNMYGKTLKDVPLLTGLDAFFFRVMGKELDERFFHRKEIIQRNADIVTRICIIFRGKIELVRTNSRETIIMETGGIFGNLSPYPQMKVSVTITAITNVDVLEMDAQRFHRLLNRYPLIKEKIQSMMSQNLDFIMPVTDSRLHVDEKEGFFEDVGVFDMAEDKISTPSSVSERDEIQEEEVISNLKPCLHLFLPWKICRIAVAPDTYCASVLENMCLLVTYFNSIIVLYQFSFQQHHVMVLIMDAIFDVFFFLKLLVDLHTSYENRFGELVSSNKLILRKFFYKRKFRRCLDIVVNIPFYYLAFLTVTIASWKNVLLYFSCVRLITLWRYMFFVDWHRRKRNTLMVNQFYSRIIYTVVSCTMMLHVFTCVWYLIACPFTYCLERSWLTVYRHSQMTVYLQNVKMLSISNYLLSAYSMMGIFMTSGGGNVIPVTPTEQIYIIITMIVSNIIVALFISEVVNVMNKLCATRVNYEYVIDEIKMYLRNGHVSSYQLDKLWRYLQQLWIVCSGRQLPRLLSSLHYVAFCDLMFEIYGHHLSNSYIFSGCEEAFLRQLTKYFKFTTYFPGNYIVQHGDSNEAMYFIHYGEIEILTVHYNLTETVHEVLQIGDMFGLVQGLYHGIPHHFSFRTKTTSRIISLRLSKWEGLLEFFPNSQKLIYNRAADIYKNM